MYNNVTLAGIVIFTPWIAGRLCFKLNLPLAGQNRKILVKIDNSSPNNKESGLL